MELVKFIFFVDFLGTLENEVILPRTLPAVWASLMQSKKIKVKLYGINQ